MEIFNRLSKWLLPAPCHLCGASVPGEGHLCVNCRQELFRRDEACCPICAVPMPVDGTPCVECLRRRPAFDRAHAGLVYGPTTRLLVHRLKYSADTSVLRDLVEPLLTQICLSSAAGYPDGLIPVPLHPSRRRRRGFNQARLIADRLGRSMHIPVLSDRVVRVRRDDMAQSTLGASARRKHMSGVFRCVGALPKHVAIVDDVMTTGSTVASLAQSLKRAGVERVDVYVLARTPPPDVMREAPF